MTDRTDDRSARPRSCAFPYLVAGALSLGVVGLSALHSRKDLARAERTLESARAQVQVVARARVVLAEIEQRIDELRVELTDYERLAPGSMTAVLSSILDALPPGAVLEAIHLDEQDGEVGVSIETIVRNDAMLDDLKDNLERSFVELRVDADASDARTTYPRVFRASFSVGQLATAKAEVRP